jgi:hypothetical protein
MTCPLCHKVPVSFMRFLLMIDPRLMRCDHCGAELRLSPKWLRIWWVWLIVGILIVLASIVLRRIIGWGLLTNLAGLFVIAMAISWYFWRSAIYEAKSEKSQSAQDLELP